MRRYLLSILLLILVHLPAIARRSEVEHVIDPDAIIRRLRDHLEIRNAGKYVGGKCGFPELVDALNAWKEFTEEEQRQVRELMAPAAMQKDRIIGRFHIYYDTTGFNEPALIDQNYERIPGTTEEYVDSVGKMFNDVWNFEIDNLGYGAPPLANDGTYHVIVRELGPGLYGQTTPDPNPISPGTPPRYATFIEIDNDYMNLPLISSRGMPGLKVTAAHEFHHAIQLGSYGLWGSNDVYFYEITSTWMEDVVYNDVNDYYQYLSDDPFRNSQFSHPEIRFTRLDGSIEYSRAIWAKFVEKRYSRVMMRRMWELIRQFPTITAIDHALSESGSSFRDAFRDYAYWNLNTGSASDTDRFYSEGRNYPSMHVAARINYIPPTRSYDDSIQSLSSAYYQVCVLASASDSCSVERQMPVIITNFNAGLQYSDVALRYTYEMRATSFDGSKHLANGLYTKIDVPDPQNWSADETLPTIVSEVVTIPNPYRVQDRLPVWFRLPVKPQSSTASFSVFTSSFDRVFSGELEVIDFKPLEPAIKWDGHAENGDNISTGIYLFVIDVDGREYVGKFAAIRE